MRKLRELKAKIYSWITLYNQKRHSLEIKWLNNNGFKTTGSIAMGKTGGNEIARIGHDVVLRADDSNADAVYTVYTILSTLPIMDKLKIKCQFLPFRNY